MIIDTEKRTHESQDFAKCDKHRGVDDTERWHDEAGDKQRATDYHHGDSTDKLEREFVFGGFHNIIGLSYSVQSFVDSIDLVLQVNRFNSSGRKDFVLRIDTKKNVIQMFMINER